MDVLVVCEPGTYQLGTGQGPLDVDTHCESSHCELLNQTTLATLEVVRRCIHPSDYVRHSRQSVCRAV